MFLRVQLVDFFQFAQQFLLPFRQLDRGFDGNVAHQVAMFAAAQCLDAFAAQAEDGAALRFGGNLDLGVAVQRGDFDFAAQGCGAETDRHFAMQVAAVALEDGVFLEVHDHIQVARRAAVDAGFAFA